MNHKQVNSEKSKWNAGVGAAIGLLLGSALADLIAPGSSQVGMLGLFTGAVIGAIIGHRCVSGDSECD